MGLETQMGVTVANTAKIEGCWSVYPRSNEMRNARANRIHGANYCHRAASSLKDMASNLDKSFI